MIYLVSSVTCASHGASQVHACDSHPAGNRIVAVVILAPDPVATEPAVASGRVEVVFDTGYTHAPVPVSNTTQACWNEQSDAGAIETCTKDVPDQAGCQPPVIAEPIPTPVDARWMPALLSLRLTLSTGLRLCRCVQQSWRPRASAQCRGECLASALEHLSQIGDAVRPDRQPGVSNAPS